MLFFATIVLLVARVCSYSDQDDAVAVFMPPSSSYTTYGDFTFDPAIRRPGNSVHRLVGDAATPYRPGEAVTNTNTGVAQMRRAPLHHGVVPATRKAARGNRGVSSVVTQGRRVEYRNRAGIRISLERDTACTPMPSVLG